MQRMKHDFDAKFAENQQKSATKCESLTSKLAAVTSSYKELSHVTRKANEKQRKLEIESSAQVKRIRTLSSENEALKCENTRLKAEVDTLQSKLEHVIKTVQQNMDNDKLNCKQTKGCLSSPKDGTNIIDDKLLDSIDLCFEQLSEIAYNGVESVSRTGSARQLDCACPDGEASANSGLTQLSHLCERLRKISTTKPPSSTNDVTSETSTSATKHTDLAATASSAGDVTESVTSQNLDDMPCNSASEAAKPQPCTDLRSKDSSDATQKESVTSAADGPIWGRRTAIVGLPGDVIQLQQVAIKTRDSNDRKISSIKRKITRKLSRKDENR